jgi:hypothetical protein
MLQGILQIQKTLDAELKQIDTDEPNILKKAETSIHLINKALNKIKALICENKFGGTDEEIQFFLRKLNLLFTAS